MSSTASTPCESTALEYTKALANRDYPKAYAMTSGEYRVHTTLEGMKELFEDIVPVDDWGTMGPIEVGETMLDWPGKEPDDLGWVTVSIGGDVYSEAIIVVVKLEDGMPKIREVEFGRP
jgi:hypothetical protein